RRVPPPPPEQNLVPGRAQPPPNAVASSSQQALPGNLLRCLHRSSPVRSQSILSSGWIQGGAVNRRQELLPNWLDRPLPKRHGEQWQRHRPPSANEPSRSPLLRR